MYVIVGLGNPEEKYLNARKILRARFGNYRAHSVMRARAAAKMISTAPIFAAAIENVYMDRSMSKIYD